MCGDDADAGDGDGDADIQGITQGLWKQYRKDYCLSESYKELPDYYLMKLVLSVVVCVSVCGLSDIFSNREPG